MVTSGVTYGLNSVVILSTLRRVIGNTILIATGGQKGEKPPAWQVEMPWFVWQTKHTLPRWKSRGVPQLGDIWYGTWTGRKPSHIKDVFYEGQRDFYRSWIASRLRWQERGGTSCVATSNPSEIVPVVCILTLRLVPLTQVT